MKIDKNNPWLIAIGGGVVVGLLLLYIYPFIILDKQQKREMEIIVSSLDTLEKRLENGTDTKALSEILSEYKNLSKEVSIKEEPKIYARIKHGEGSTYYELSKLKDKEHSLIEATRAYQEALKIRTVEKYPVDYATTQNSLGNANRALSEIRDKEENSELAIKAYQQALKIFTVEKYPLYHKTITSNLKLAKQELR